ncbi:MAG: hypothetical protein V1664_05305 [Candidatus Uhrbacteria bacterium]
MKAFEWVNSEIGITPPGDFYCQSRDIAQARTEKLPALLISVGWSEDQAGLFSAVIGELVGNCFDHNIGQWKDIPGCWLETQIDKNSVRIFIADRGQGVLASLQRVLPDLSDPVEALKKAFTEIITGRAPEKRGNGLKFVLRSLQKIFNVESFVFISDSAKLFFADLIELSNFDSHLEKIKLIRGTYSEILIRKI